MSRMDADEIPFHEASAYFSEEEWTLLQEWQKELYSNVMKEIHQALLSLGPLIASTIFSLKAKEKQELFPVAIMGYDKGVRSNWSPSDTSVNRTESSTAYSGEILTPHSPPGTEESETNDCLSTGEKGIPFPNPTICSMKEEAAPASIFIDHLGVEVGEIGNSSSKGLSSGQAFMSFHIKEEASIYCVDIPESKRLECVISSPTDDGSMNRKRKRGRSPKHSKKSPLCKPLPEETCTPALLYKEAHSGSQLWLENYQEMQSEEMFPIESGFSNSEHILVHKERTKVKRPPTYNEEESCQSNVQFHNGLLKKEQNRSPYTCTDCDQSYILKAELISHMEAHSGARPYICSVCEKSFFQKAHLMKHYRTHTGEKPFLCPFCHKGFSRKDNLNGHVRTHTGEKPYKCHECVKSFSWKKDLNNHRRRMHEP
ncbi:zinc finger protein 177-like isoform X2 [Ambystoma mexicanum]|uniref:zinc finger protein 177-like isoform X2 n=1 Tax=Ambystoma mexicanum TaxID=8296 RepID=UPI0037E91C99